VLALSIVLCLGHDEYKVREQATVICSDPSYEPYVRLVLNCSCPEIRRRASSIIARADAKRENYLFYSQPELYYRLWLLSGGLCNWYVNDTRLIKDVQRRSNDMFMRLCRERNIFDPGAWTRPNYSEWDHPRLDEFRKRLNHKDE
jgi:hypothetical protein